MKTENATSLNYKGYVGSIETSLEDNCLFGSVQGLKSTTLISYEGTTIVELQKDFEGAIDDYLTLCYEKGKTPQISFSIES